MISFFYFVFVCVMLFFGSSTEEFGVTNELGFVWVRGDVNFFFFSILALCLAITWPLDLQIK